MFKQLMVVMMILLLAAPAYAIDSVYNRDSIHDADGWTAYTTNDDVDSSAAELVARGTGITQLAAEDEIEVVTTYANTPSTVVWGIDNRGRKRTETITSAGDGLADTSSTVFRYIEGASITPGATASVTIRRESDDATILTIPIGSTRSQVAHHFNGEYVSYVTGLSVHGGTATNNTTAATQSVTAHIRWYADDADSLDATDDFETVASVFYDGSIHPNSEAPIIQPIRLKAGGWIAVYALGAEDNQKITVSLEGYDANR